MKKGLKKERELILYWYYSIMKLFPEEKIDNPKIKECINILKIYHNNKFKIEMRDRDELFKNRGDAFAFARLCLIVPQRDYDVDFESAITKSIEINRKNNEISESEGFLSSKPTVSQIAHRYEEIFFDFDDNKSKYDFIELEEYNTLFQLMIPDDPWEKFFEFIEELTRKGLVHIRKSDHGSSSAIKDYGLEKKSNVLNRGLDVLIISGIFSDVKGSNWKNVSMELVSDSSLSIKIKGLKAKRYSYAQMGLSDRRKSDVPNHIWSFIKVLAELRGDIPKRDLILDNESNSDLKARKHVEKSVSRLRKFLKQLTGINVDPFNPFSKKIGYQAKFKIRDCRTEQYLNYLSEEEKS